MVSREADDDNEGINGSTSLAEKVEREGQEFGALAQLVHSDGLVDGQGGGVTS